MTNKHPSTQAPKHQMVMALMLAWTVSVADAQVMSPRAASQQPQPAVRLTSAATGLNLPAVVVTGVPSGESVSLRWDNPISGDFDGVSVYASSNRLGPWRKVGTVLVPAPPTLTASNIFLPQWFVARSFVSVPSPIVLQPDIVTESDDSNMVGFLGWMTIVTATNHNEMSTNLLTWSEISQQQVFNRTNPPGVQQYFRSKLDVALKRQAILE